MNTPTNMYNPELHRKACSHEAIHPYWDIHSSNTIEEISSKHKDPSQDLNGEKELATWKDWSTELCSKYAISQEVKNLMDKCEAKARSVKVNYQPYVDTLDELFDFHEKKAPKFTSKVMQLAQETGGKPLIPALKGKERCLAKATYKYADAGGVAWYRLTDIVRATILYPSISAMYKGLEAIEKDENIEIIELNDRYQKLGDTKVYPENGWLEDEFPFGMTQFQGLCWFQGVYMTFGYL